MAFGMLTLAASPAVVRDFIGLLTFIRNFEVPRSLVASLLLTVTVIPAALLVRAAVSLLGCSWYVVPMSPSRLGWGRRKRIQSVITVPRGVLGAMMLNVGLSSTDLPCSLVVDSTAPGAGEERSDSIMRPVLSTSFVRAE